MPNAEAGWNAIEISDILKLDINEIERLTNWILSIKQVLLVISPSNIYIKYRYSSISMMLGVGSLIIKGSVNPPTELRKFTLSRRDWINGCWISKEPRYNFLISKENIEVKGTTVATSLKDPVALLSNGISGLHKLFKIEDNELLRDLIPLVKVKKYNVVFKTSENEYFSIVADRELKRILTYIMPLASACGPSP